MNLEHYYWFFSKALSNSLCEDIIKYGNEQQEQLALIGKQTNKINKGKSLTEEDLNPVRGSILLQNDSDGKGDYIAKWEHPTLAKPTDEELA